VLGVIDPRVLSTVRKAAQEEELIRAVIRARKEHGTAESTRRE